MAAPAPPGWIINWLTSLKHTPHPTPTPLPLHLSFESECEPLIMISTCSRSRASPLARPPPPPPRRRRAPARRGAKEAARLLEGPHRRPEQRPPWYWAGFFCQKGCGFAMFRHLCKERQPLLFSRCLRRANRDVAGEEEQRSKMRRMRRMSRTRRRRKRRRRRWRE